MHSNILRHPLFFSLLLIALCADFRPSTVLADKKAREKLLKTSMPQWPTEPLSEAARERAMELFTQMAKAPEELQSGIVDGVKIRFFEEEKDTRTYSWHLVFDKAGRKRFKNTTDGRTLHYIHTGQEILTMIETPPGRPRPYPIYRQLPEPRKVLDDARPPCLDRIGFLSGVHFEVHFPEFAGFKRGVLDRFPSQFVGFRETQDNLIVLMQEFGLSQPRTSEQREWQFRGACWIDPKLGNRQVKYVEWWKVSENADWELSLVSTVEWIKINSIYVPKHYLAISNQNGVSGFELKLNWQTANDWITNDEFEWQKFDPPLGTEIINRKTGERVVEGRVGDLQ